MADSFLLFLYLESFCILVFDARYAASCCVQAAPVLIPMAQIKPNSSRPIAVMMTRDDSLRQLPTDHDYAVSTREYQLDQSSPPPASAAADPVFERQRRKQTPRIRTYIDRVTPYQRPLLLSTEVGKRQEAWGHLSGMPTIRACDSSAVAGECLGGDLALIDVPGKDRRNPEPPVGDIVIENPRFDLLNLILFSERVTRTPCGRCKHLLFNQYILGGN